ncbi:hypothetical protein VTK73DRAFT_7610 [Phialemonium thermophilum]|uniref:Arrestin C-terminal-like domain-containing protein n=1 Tax=Phialemonium thermophilum TaxID=223376 RepID=A0ABR3Y7K4_9PEZI
MPAVGERTITATIELLKGGCLAGDMLPVKISVQHIKRIKSLHGVIVTLYRQGRIDWAPPPSLFRNMSKEEAKRIEKEDYYPKSRTGLGGLSLSSAGSCSVFRKDLSQTFNPLIIDPVTLTASVTTSVRVPEDVFPTIKGVPGDMITFKYQLEVIVDLGGKLAGQIQSNQSSVSRANPTLMPSSANPYEGGVASSGSWNGNPIDTDRLRREKGVISVAFEVLVGTVDSMRQRARGMSRNVTLTHTQQIAEPTLFERPSDERAGEWQTRTEEEGRGSRDYHPPYGPPVATGLPNQPSYYIPPEPSAPALFPIPPPQIPDEGALSEKERMRQAEQRLLPSQPTAPPAAESSSAALLDGENIYEAEVGHIAGPSHHHERVPPPPLLGDSEPSALTDGPSAPTLEQLSAGNVAHSTDDKQELERQRLLAEASAPPEFPEDYDAGPVAGPSSPAAAPSAVPLSPQPGLEPTAPVLEEDALTEADEDTGVYGTHYSYHVMNNQPSGDSQTRSGPSEPLPRYEQ